VSLPAAHGMAMTEAWLVPRGGGPTFSSGTSARGAFLALVCGLGLGIPFLLAAALFQRTMNVLAFFKRNACLAEQP
jgi:hypothetical protein